MESKTLAKEKDKGQRSSPWTGWS